MANLKYTNSHNNYLALDGGGAKGIYTLAILEEIEKLLGSDRTLKSLFNNVYGTSTGSIIATWIALGKPVKDLDKEIFFISVRYNVPFCLER